MTEDVQRALRGDHELTQLGVRPPLSRYLGDIWRRRDFVFAAPLGELRAQHRNTVLGSTWHLLNPLLLASIYYIIFGVILDAGRGIDNYVAFLIIGMFVFYYTQKTALGSARAVVANVRLIQSLTFPRSILPLSGLISESIAHLPAVATMLTLVLLTGVRPTAAWLGLPLALALQAVFNLGLALTIGRAAFHFRDVQQLLPYVTRIWFYFSGVLFAISRVPEGLPRTLFQLNPAFAYVDIHRALLLDARFPVDSWLVGAVWAGVALITGGVFFRQGETMYGRGW